MNKLLLIVLFTMLGLCNSFADITHTLSHNLTVNGAPLSGTTVSTNQTLTTDSVYETGASSFGYSVLVTQVSGNGVKISYQTSYDNANWFTPNTTSPIGVLTPVGTLDTLATSNTWIIYQYPVSPYIRFVYTSTGGSSIITGETVWQDWV